jgi:hypothetical protein
VNAKYIGTSTAIFENPSGAASSFLQLMNPSTKPFIIASGTELAFVRSSISFQIDSSLTFETGGFTQRMKLDKAGVVTIPNRIGIGTTDPATKFHVSTGTVANAQYITNAIGTLESSTASGSVFFQLMNPSTTSFSIGSGTDLSFYRSGLSFQADSSITFETGGYSERMKIDKTGTVSIPNRIGIGTTSPFAKLHVSSGSLANAQYIFNALSVFESSTAASSLFMQLMNPSSSSFSIGSGTELSFYRSGISFQPDSSVTIEAGGFTQRMKIDKAGVMTVPNRVGIGNTSPVTKFHVSSGTVSNAQYITNAVGIFENASAGTSVFMQLMNPSSSSFSIGSGTELSFYRSGISFLADSAISFEAGGFVQRMKIDKAGIVNIPNALGIGTSSPGADLDVNGTAIIGTNGTVLTEVIKVTINKNVASVNGNSSVTEVFTVPNVQTTSTVYISPATALANGLLIGYARVFPANNVEVRFTNVTASSIDPPAMDFYITIIR